jgi:hypothetical protein
MNPAILRDSCELPPTSRGHLSAATRGQERFISSGSSQKDELSVHRGSERALLALFKKRAGSGHVQQEHTGYQR